MTRLRSTALGCLAALVLGGAATSAFAIEPGTFNYLAGASNGIPGGAAAPPGVYVGYTAAEGLYGPMTGNQGGGAPGSENGFKLGSFIGVPAVIWSTGYNFLGAAYSVAVIQPFVTAFAGTAHSDSAGLTAPAGTSLGTQQMILNTIWQPINLSWNLGNGWFVGAAFSFQGPDGTIYAGNANPDYWTFEPGLGISYLSANWNVTANLAYSFYTSSKGTNAVGGEYGYGTGYTNGNLFSGDTNALYKIGKWQIGPVADFEVQTSSDHGGTVATVPPLAGLPASAFYANQTSLFLGGYVAYDFGPVDIAVWAITPVVADNTAQGTTVFTRIGFKLWGPETPKPLVAKN